MSYLGSVPSFGTPYSNNKIEVFSGNGSNTEFTLTYRVSGREDLEIVVNNVQQSPFDGSYDIVNNNILTFSDAPSSGSNNIHIYYRGFSHNVSVPAANSINSYHLATTGVVAGTYGNTTAIPVVTIDATGRVTSATTNSVSGVTGLTYTNANTSVTVATSTVNYSANIEPGLNQAYANAVSVAATDASTKAATAYSNATSTASADATSKAATAYSNAATYADTKAATAYSNATSYTDTVAATKASLSGATFTGAVAVSNTIAAGNTTITGFVNATSMYVDGGNINSTGLMQITAGGTKNLVLTPGTGAVVRANGALTVTGTATFADVTISGNLTTSGTTTYVNTTNLNVGDNIVTLNADLGATAPTEDAGIEVNRGSSANVALRWYEAGDEWQITTDGTNYLKVATNTDVSTAYTNATIYSANASNISSGTLAFARLPSAYIGTTAIQSSSASQALAGITTLAAGNTTITGFANVSGGLNVGGGTTLAAATITNGLVVGTTITANGATGGPSQVLMQGLTGNTYWSDELPSVTNVGAIPIKANLGWVGSNTNASSLWMNFGSNTLYSNSNLSVSGTLAAGNTSINGLATVVANNVLRLAATSSGWGSVPIQFGGSDSTYYAQGMYMCGDVGATQKAWRVGPRYDSSTTALTFGYSTTDQAYGSNPVTLTYSEIARFAANGNIGFGNTSPSHKLSVNGTGYFYSNVTVNYSSGGASYNAITQTPLWVSSSNGISNQDILTLDGGPNGFNGPNDANTAFSMLFNACAYLANTGVVSRTGASITMLKSGSWNEAAGGPGTFGHLVFKTNSGSNLSPNLSERMRITYDGNVGIGITTPGYKHTVSAAANTYAQCLFNNTNLAGQWGGLLLSNNPGGYYFGAIKLVNTTSNPSVLNPNMVFALQDNGTEALANMVDRLVISTNGHILPGANNTQDIGSSTMVWRHMYTGDLFLSNEGHEEGNDVDGTKGKWTIQEGAEDLFIINRNTGKKYRFKLEEM